MYTEIPVIMLVTLAIIIAILGLFSLSGYSLLFLYVNLYVSVVIFLVTILDELEIRWNLVTFIPARTGN